MRSWFEIRESDDPWRGRQPKYERIVRLAPGGFGLATKLPSGKPITVRLGNRFAKGSAKPS
jgi:hypothetical protein